MDEGDCARCIHWYVRYYMHNLNRDLIKVVDRSQCLGLEASKELHIVRDDRVYRLDDHFFVSPLLVYEYGTKHQPAQKITIDCKHIFTSTRPTRTPRVVDGAGQLDHPLGASPVPVSGKQLDVEKLQVTFQKAHHWQDDVCYVCARYNGLCRATTTTQKYFSNCCNYCLKTDQGRARSEEDVHEAWLSHP